MSFSLPSTAPRKFEPLKQRYSLEKPFKRNRHFEKQCTASKGDHFERFQLFVRAKIAMEDDIFDGRLLGSVGRTRRDGFIFGLDQHSGMITKRLPFL